MLTCCHTFWDTWIEQIYWADQIYCSLKVRKFRVAFMVIIRETCALYQPIKRERIVYCDVSRVFSVFQVMSVIAQWLHLTSRSVHWVHSVLLSVIRCATARSLACLTDPGRSSSFAPHPPGVQAVVRPCLSGRAFANPARPASRRLRADRNDLEVQESHVTSPGGDVMLL